VDFSPAPRFVLEEEYQLQQILKTLIAEEVIKSAHDVSEGGLITALLESAFHRELGFDVHRSDDNIRKDAFWFGESQSRVVVSVSPHKLEAFDKLTENLQANTISLGRVSNNTVTVDGEDWGVISRWKALYDTAIEKHLVKETASGALEMI
jgi:phosphoribosylformylglycinamidine synthase